jgi:hypothetical protein
MEHLPKPLVPSDVDLRDFQFMPVDVRRLLTSETWMLGDGEERAAAMTLWLESWHQVPAGSLPSNDRMLAHLSQCAKWSRVKSHALRGWIACDDGRLYHPVVCEKVLEAWISKLSERLGAAEGNAKRWNADIDARPYFSAIAVAAERLRALNPHSKALGKKLLMKIKNDSPPESPPESPPDSPPESPPESGGSSRGDRKGQGQGQGQGHTQRAGGDGDRSRHESGLPHDVATPSVPTRAAAACVAMRAEGLIGTNPSHPGLLELIATGAEVGEFSQAARQAIEKGKGFAYALAIVRGQRSDAAKLASQTGAGKSRATAEALEAQWRPLRERAKASGFREPWQLESPAAYETSLRLHERDHPVGEKPRAANSSGSSSG